MKLYKAVSKRIVNYESWSDYVRNTDKCIFYALGRSSAKKTTPLLAFDTLTHAANFLFQHSNDYDEVAILECSGKPSKIQDFSFLRDCTVPEGTVCADEITPFREVPPEEYTKKCCWLCCDELEQPTSDGLCLNCSEGLEE